MKRETLNKFLIACTGVFPDGVITVKDKSAVVAHTDTANVAMGYVILKEFDIPDGQYGVDFNKARSFVGAVKDKEGDIKIENSYIKMKFGKTTKGMSTLNISTLRPTRPRISEKLKFICKIEVDKNELIDIIDVIDKSMSTQNNTVAKTIFTFDGNALSVKSDDQIDFTEKIFDITSVECGKGERAASSYPFLHLKEFTSVFKKFDTTAVTISFGNNTPVIFALKDEDVEIEYFLAQMVEDTQCV